MWRQQDRPHSERVAAPLHTEPFNENVHALMCLCVHVQVWLHGARKTLGCTQAVSAVASPCPHTLSAWPNTHTNTQTRPDRDNECHWQGYYSVSCVLTTVPPPLFSTFWSILFSVWKIMRTSLQIHQIGPTSSAWMWEDLYFLCIDE